MRILFLIGSLTIGAALAGGLSEFGTAARFAFGAAAIAGAMYLYWSYKETPVATPRAAFVVDKESERYSESDVEDFFDKLSEAKAKSAAPFRAGGIVSGED